MCYAAPESPGSIRRAAHRAGSGLSNHQTYDGTKSRNFLNLQ